jgi:hypothetical protein
MCADPGVATAPLYNTLEVGWKEQQAKPKPDLKMALVKGNTAALVITGLLYLVAQVRAQAARRRALFRVLCGFLGFCILCRVGGFCCGWAGAGGRVRG